MIVNFTCCLTNNLLNTLGIFVIKIADEAGFYSSLLKSYKSFMCLL